MRILFFMRSRNYDRHFEWILWLLGERGHRVHVAFDVEKKDGYSSGLLDRICELHPNVTYGLVPERLDVDWAHFANGLRLSIDYLRFLEPAYENAVALRERAELRSPALTVRVVKSSLERSARARHRFDRALRAVERTVPSGPAVDDFIATFAPDVVLVTPLVGFGSPQGDYVRSAQTRGLPTALLVASWDNLTNKGRIRERPELTVVWNEAQRREAVELHGLPSDRVIATGAHTYDHWFEWRPSTDRQEFCRKVGLDPERPMLLYVCSSSFIAPNEASFVAGWVRQIRQSTDPALREAGILIRPHPANAAMWKHADLTEPGRTVIWPREGATPNDEQRKSDYFDSIHHCRAVVGINTSALLESAIQERPVFTLVTEEHQHTQEGTLHFGHIAAGNGKGFLQVAHSIEEHTRQLGAALKSPNGYLEANRRFVESFLRPLGVASPAAPKAVDAIEALAAEHLRRGRRAPASHRLTRALLRPAVRIEPTVAGGLRHFGIRAQRPEPRLSRPATQTLRVLFVLDHPGLLIHFDETVRTLGRAGHTVHISFARPHKWAEGLEVLRDAPRVIVRSAAPPRRDAFARTVRGIRAAADYVHYLDPRLASAGYSRRKARDALDVPAALLALTRGKESLGRGWVRLLTWLLAGLEDAVPSDPTLERFIRKTDPDVLLVSPLINRPTYQTDYVKSARALGIPTALCVASWDNLSSKGRVRLLPDQVICWNDVQKREAIDLHRVPESRIVVTGAQPFDRWFDRAPTASREDFCSRFGLASDKPFVLFVGSTRQHLAEDEEERFVRDWIQALRSCDDPVLRNLSVLVRPHPRTAGAWKKADLSGLGAVAVWNRERPLPVNGGDRAEYFDSLYHSTAVVGINSSAMIEAALVGRPVHTIALPKFWEMQRGLVHYHYLLTENGGFLREASSFDAHVRLLARDLRDPARARQEQLGFIESFIRPGGTDVPATPAVVETVEKLGKAPRRVPAGSGATARWLRPLVVATALQQRATTGGVRFLGGLAPQVSDRLLAAAHRLMDHADAVEAEGGESPSVTAAASIVKGAAGWTATVGTLSRKWLKRHDERTGWRFGSARKAKIKKVAKARAKGREARAMSGEPLGAAEGASPWRPQVEPRVGGSSTDGSAARDPRRVSTVRS